MREHGSEVGCRVVEWVKGGTLRWLGCIERIGKEGFVKVCLRSVEGSTSKKGKPLGRWEDRMKECESGRGE